MNAGAGQAVLPDLNGPHAHHFESAEQQYSAAKLGMWIFLVTEVLLFSGLFCVYAIYRNAHPELFLYGARFLDARWGAINTVVLLLSSLTMALAVRCAQKGDRRGLVLTLAATLLLGADFMGIKFIEYRHKFHDNLVFGPAFAEHPDPEAARRAAEARAAAEEAERRARSAELVPGDVETGRRLFLGTCAACHGRSGDGKSIKNKSLPRSEFIAGRNDADLLAFIKRGRGVDDPLNTTGLVMLPKGGNPRLSDQDLMHVIAFIRMLQEHARNGTTPPDAGPAPAAVVQPAASPVPVPAMTGVARTPGTPLDPRDDPGRPRNAHMFFAVYFGMTGLHGIHVLGGMLVIAWLLRRAVRGDFSRRYFTPVEVGGLYWHLVDLIWIYLFPLLYLIH